MSGTGNRALRTSISTVISCFLGLGLSDAGPGVIGRRVSLMGRGQEELARGNPPPLFFRSCAGLRAPGRAAGARAAAGITSLPGWRGHPGAGAPRGGGGGAGARGFAVATAVMSLAHPNPRLVVVCFSSACS